MADTLPCCDVSLKESVRRLDSTYWVSISGVEVTVCKARKKRIFRVTLRSIIHLFAQERAILTIGACMEAIFVPPLGRQVRVAGFSGTS